MEVVAVYRDRNRPVALVVMGSTDSHALVWMTFTDQGVPVPVEVTMRATAAPSERRCRELLRDFRPPRGGTVTTSMLRSLSLSGAWNAAAAQQEPKRTRMARLASLQREPSDQLPEGFRNRRDYGAAQERVLVAALYVDQVQAGTSTPVQAVAEKLGKTPAWVNKRLAAARSAGYLTSYGHGRRGGELTEKAWSVIDATRDEDTPDDWDEEEDEELTDEELAELADEDWSEEEGVPLEDDEELDTYGGWVLCHACLTPYEYLDENSACANCVGI